MWVNYCNLLICLSSHTNGRTITGHDNEMLVTSGKTVNTVVAADEMM